MTMKTETVLYVDESAIRSKSDADRLRGISPTLIVRKLSTSLDRELRTYLLRDVLDPMLAPQLVSVQDAAWLLGRIL